MLWMVLFLAKSRTLEKPQLQPNQDMLCYAYPLGQINKCIETILEYAEC